MRLETRERRFSLFLLFFLWSLVSGLWSLQSYAEPRNAKVAGAFYPADPQELRTLITQFLDRFPAPDNQTAAKPRALILPHAGYRYSGIVAARGFREAQGRSYDAVVVVGFTHRDQFEGTSVDDREAYQTPLGTIPVEQHAVAFLKTRAGIHHLERAHASSEHSVEVMLPFLQVALGEFQVVPLLMGSVEPSDAEALADALAALAAQGNYLFVFSTDLSHYHPYEQAVQLDRATTTAMVFETPQAVDRLFRAGALEACGRGPIVASLLFAQRLGYLQRRGLAYANSGDTTGEKARVVGYAAIGLYPRAAADGRTLVSQEAGQALVRAARQVLESHFKSTTGTAPVALDRYPELTRPRGTFVTLRRKTGELRGCIGRIESDTPLSTLLPTVTLDAALRDSRFQPVSADELEQLTVEVSVLTPPQPIQSPQEIVAGRDGVVLRKDDRSGVFLPQVWTESGMTRLEFLRELASQKAGLEPDAWKQASLFTFQDQVFEEAPTSSDVTPH